MRSARGRPRTYYGGMVDLPLVVTRPDEATLFDDDELEAAGDPELWAKFDAMHGSGMLSVERSLRDDLLGEAAWSALGHSSRTVIASGEKIYREHRDDPSFDFAGVLGVFAKAIGVHVARVLPRVLRKLPGHLRMINLDGRTVDLAGKTTFGLAVTVHILTDHGRRTQAIAAAATNGSWLVNQFPAILDAFRDVHNPGTHSDRIDCRTAKHWREQMLGVGGVGHLVELSRVRAG
jgi:hypothetical protein